MPAADNRAKPPKTIKPAKNPKLIGTDKRSPQPDPTPKPKPNDSSR